MKHYEERLERDEAEIRDGIRKVAALVETALRNAVHALLAGDRRLANETVLGDGEINRAVRALDHSCHAFIVRHLPSAGHLRLMSATIRTGIALERIGDYAVNISRESIQLSAPPGGRLARSADHMADQVIGMLHDATAAFCEGNAEKAKGIMLLADQVEHELNDVLADLTAEHDARSMKDLFALFVVFSTLERVSDQAKNMCEEAVFAVTGQMKARKVYRILFLDKTNNCQSQMAEAIARKHFPNSGEYKSEGTAPAAALDESMKAFLEERGYDLSHHVPRPFDETAGELEDYHVVVSLDGPITDYLKEIPFPTITLEWDVGEAPCSADDSASRLETMYRELSLQVRDLLERLHGIGAD